ncbi:hypothetical protein [Marinigracilibium pacificum]|uniref:Dolichyl-phosphate-mannose-protein mannosyltransferase n=1 Tax=Marinigracilibium pacificum TaxID=2729599 RepID=A0A848IXS5_9BACT|nr:hypothetical protein [Marinigracilibium pacificum]NMM49097.1 hypothetical protein [Marinigracilibium pacificum]
MKSKSLKFFLLIFSIKFILASLVSSYYLFYSKGDLNSYLFDLQVISNELGWSFNKTFEFYINNGLLNSKLIYGNDFRALTFEKVLYPFYRLSFKSIWILNAIIALSQSYLFTRIKFGRKINRYIYFVLLSMFFVPGLAFWTSGVLKESVYLILILYIIWVTYNKQKFVFISFSILAAYIAFLIKPYNSVFLCGFLFVFFLFGTSYNLVLKLVLTGMLIIGSIFILPSLNPNFSFDRVSAVIEENSSIYLSQCNDDNCIPIDTEQSVLASKNILISFFYGLYGPISFLSENIFIKVSSINSLMFLFISLATIYLIIKQKTYNFNVAITITYIIFVSILTSLTTLNYGTLMRYSIYYSSFVWGGFFLFFEQEMWSGRNKNHRLW